MAIFFYRTNQLYGCFSNFSAHGFREEGLYWATSEHYFQAHKFLLPEVREAVRLAPSPMDAARLGRDRGLPLRADWEAIKDDVMRRAVLLKFQANEDIRGVLLGTGDEELVERTTDDYYWGCGTDGTGKNRLGQILMDVRAILRMALSNDGE